MHITQKIAPFFTSKRFFLFFITSLTLLVFLFRINRPDTIGDSGHELLRGYTYMDFIESTIQTTPLQWMPLPTWWTYLGFHDAPYFGFLFYFLILQFSYNNITLVAISSNAILGAISVIGITYCIYTQACDWKKTRALFFLSTYFACTSLITLLRSAYIEAPTIWLVQFGFYFYILDDTKTSRYKTLAFILFGCAFATKYTSVFVITGPILYLLYEGITKKIPYVHFLKYLRAFLIPILPVIIYNVMMWIEFGHFDMQFSSLFGIHSKDHWGTFQHHPFDTTEIKSFFTNFFHTFWGPLTCAITLLIGFYFIKNKNHTTPLEKVLLISFLFSCFGMILFSGGYPYNISLLLSMLLLIATIAIKIDVSTIKKTRYIIFCYLYVLALCGGIITTALMNYSYFNHEENIFSGPRIQNLGWNQLNTLFDFYLKDKNQKPSPEGFLMYDPKLAVNKRHLDTTIPPEKTAQDFPGIIIIDNDLSWLHGFLTFFKQRWMKNFFVLRTNELAEFNRYPDIYKQILATLTQRTYIEEYRPTSSRAQNTLVTELLGQNPHHVTVCGPDDEPRFIINGDMADFILNNKNNPAIQKNICSKK